MLKIRCAWNCLRGRPTIYGVQFRGGIEVEHVKNTIIANNTFRGRT